MLISGLSLNLISVIWWITINKGLMLKNGITIGFMFYMIPVSGAISLFCALVMRKYTLMFDIAYEPSGISIDEESSNKSNDLSDFEIGSD